MLDLGINLVWGCSSNGRALALHARGTGIDALLLHFWYFCLCVLCDSQHAYTSYFERRREKAIGEGGTGTNGPG